MIISVGGKEAPQSLTKIEAAAYGGAPSAQGSRALDRGRDAMARPPAIDIVSAMNDPAFERRGYVASLEDTNTIRFAFGRRLISLR